MPTSEVDDLEYALLDVPYGGAKGGGARFRPLSPGKPVGIGGSLGRSSATSKRVAHIALAALKHLGLGPGASSAAVQGFGKVGAGAAAYLADAGVTVKAVSDQYGAVSADGFDVKALAEHVDRAGSVLGFPEGSPWEADALLELNVDVLVPTAVESVLTEDNAARVRA